MELMLRRMRQDKITAHGSRSSFSDWTSEVSWFSGEPRERRSRTRSRTRRTAPTAVATLWKSGEK